MVGIAELQEAQEAVGRYLPSSMSNSDGWFSLRSFGQEIYAPGLLDSYQVYCWVGRLDVDGWYVQREQNQNVLPGPLWARQVYIENRSIRCHHRPTGLRQFEVEHAIDVVSHTFSQLEETPVLVFTRRREGLRVLTGTSYRPCRGIP